MLNFLKLFGFISASISLSIMMLPCFSWGQEYPTKPIQILLGWPPGGLACVLAELVAQEGKKYVPAPIITVYKTGAGGTIAAYFAAKSSPDGYTMLMGRPSAISFSPFTQKLEYAPEDFEVMAQVATAPLTLATRTDAPWKTLKELVHYAKNNPGTVTCGNAGMYGAKHLQAIQFEKLAGIKFTHVPFKGANDTTAALAGGHIMLDVRFPGEGEALVEAGKIKILTVFDSKRCKFYPQVSTSMEEGYPMEVASWCTIMGPKGTPKRISTYWENFIKKLTLDNQFVEKAEKLKIIVEFKSAEDFKKYLAKEVQEVKEMTKELGLKPM